MKKLKPSPTSIKLLLFPGMKFWIKTQQRTIKLALIVTFNITLADLKHINIKTWHIFQTDPKLNKIFQEPHCCCLLMKQDLHEFIGDHKH